MNIVDPRDTLTEISCSACDAKKAVKKTAQGNPRLPNGWKRRPGSEEPLCKDCTKGSYRTFAVTLPVTGPVFVRPEGDERGGPQIQGEAWAELRDRLYNAFWISTQLANWALTTLYAAETQPTANQESIGPAPDLYLYGLLKNTPHNEDWSGAMNSAQSIMRVVAGRYKKERGAVLGSRLSSLSSYKFPTPYPVHNKNWNIQRNSADGRFSVSLPLPGGRVNLLLAGGKTLAYQHARLMHFVNGTAKKCEAAVYAVPVGANDTKNRQGMKIRARSRLKGRERMEYRIMIKLVGLFPHTPRKDLKGTMNVRTIPTSMLVVEQEGVEPWFYHGDEVRTHIAGYHARLQRFRDDLKHEYRWPKEMRTKHREAEALFVRKNAKWQKAMIDQISAMIANLAERRGVADVTWDDRCREFIPSWSYYLLRASVQRKCGDRGIAFYVVGGEDDAAENGEPPARETEGSE